MPNIVDYVNWRADLSFKSDPLNYIDAVILSVASYIDYDKSVSRYPSVEACSFKESCDEVFLDKEIKKMTLGAILPHTLLELVKDMSITNRYKNIKVSNYVNKIDKKTKMQFSAITFHINKNTLFISFRGTDDTLIGWQENIDMTTTFPVPAQKEAAKYLNKIAKLFPETNIYLGGHSKGGNLASYAAIYCNDDIKERLLKSFSCDGPGFYFKKIDEEKYNKVKDKLYHIIPEQSVVGLIFDEIETNRVVVKSNAKGVFQHDACSWQLMGNKFIECEDVTLNAKKLDEAITKMLEDLSDEEKIQVSNEVYNFMIKINDDTLLQAQKDVLKLVANLNMISGKNKKIFAGLVFDFIRYKGI